MKPVMTTFEGSLNRVPTMSDIRGLSNRYYGGVSVDVCCRKIAKRAGGLHVLLADGSLRVFTRLECGKIRCTTHKAGAWKFSS